MALLYLCPMTTSYEDLVDRLHAVKRVSENARARMGRCRPGSPEGQRLALLLQGADRRYDEIRREIRNHPDAPVAG